MRAWWVIACAGFLFSVSAKALADAFLRAPLPLVGPWIGLDYATNPGIAFGIALPPVLQPVLIGLAFGALLLFRRLWLPHPFCGIGIGMILGGGAANIVDRLRDGRVTDFLVLWPFPLFNVADVLITLGAVLLLGGEWLIPSPPQPSPCPLPSPAFAKATAGKKGEGVRSTALAGGGRKW